MTNKRLEAMEKENSIMREALQWAFEMFLARDEMNAKVHCAPLRLSPITERVKQALAADTDPSPWCSHCGARTRKQCDCGPILEND